jgi:hypothetical protein
MSKNHLFSRPTFAQALKAWRELLAERKFPTELLWVFDENLCFEKDAASQAGFKLGFQTRFSPPPADAEQIAYDHFCGFEAPIVFYRLGSSGGKSVCVILCDGWFEQKNESAEWVCRDEWLLAFRPGADAPTEEITDEPRWRRRILRDRPLHDLDFCMTLQSIHEILAHGRVLTAYEHYALKFFGSWRRFLGEKK